MVNIREQCSWITEDKMSGTEKAKILSLAGYERAKRLKVVPTKVIPIARSTLVVGGGIAGLNASLDLANQDIKVFLIESKTTIGGRMAQLDRTFPTDDCSI